MNVMTASSATAQTARTAARPPFADFVSASALASAQAYLDPLDEDEPTDDIVVTTRRAISRVALVATETAGRFQREGVPHDPMTWMLSSRTLFSGESAVDACLTRDACLRGILLHGLSIGLDADPAAIDALASNDDDHDDADDDIDFAGYPFERDEGRGGSGKSEDQSSGEPRLFTATVVAFDGFEVLQAFHASLATDQSEIAGRLYMRMGAAMADAIIVDGFDPTVPLVTALVAPAICDTLMLIASNPASQLAAGMDLNVEQRFLA